MTQAENQLPPPESQRQRWIKYGANVVISSIVVIVIAALLVYLAQSHPVRHDTTRGGSESLRPQTIDFLKKLNVKVHIVAVYPKLKTDNSNNQEQDYYTPVADVLNNYAAANKNITTEIFDPDTDKQRFNDLLTEVTTKYGGDVKSYKQLLDTDVPNANTALIQFASTENAQFPTEAAEKLDQSSELFQSLYLCRATLAQIPSGLSKLKEEVGDEEQQPIPSYKAALDAVAQDYNSISQILAVYKQVMDGLAASKDAPDALKAYAPGAAERVKDAQASIDALAQRIDKLPPLKELGEFSDQLKSKSIIIMVDKPEHTPATDPSTEPSDQDEIPGYKILPFAAVWKVPPNNPFAPTVGPKFLTLEAEQQVTAGIASMLADKRTMVVFVRSGGAPLTQVTPDGQVGQLALVADRLREFNFDVEEKDASGQPNQQEMPTPEPTEEQMKTAVWVVYAPSQDQMMGGPSNIGPMLDKHLADGGAAMVFVSPNADPLSDVFSNWGIEAKPTFVITHEQVSAEARQPTDRIDALLQHDQTIFVTNQYGDHPVVKPLAGLSFLQYMPIPVGMAKSQPPGIKVTPIFPVPLSPHFWASSNAMRVLQQANSTNTPPPTLVYTVKGDPNEHPIDDIDNTADNRIYMGAVAEKTGGGRLIVFGSPVFAFNELITLPDADRPDAVRYPGNAEFFMDSVLWLAHMDDMVAISPHALQVARVSDLSPAAQNFWRYGVLTFGLPALVILAGIMTYLRRRD